MGLETVTNIKDLNAANPVSNADTVASMAPHIRNIKTALLADVSDGAILTKGTATATGTADAMIADFSPDIVLSDGVTVFIHPVGQITITNPTFTPDGLASKPIVKGHNQALSLLDIVGFNQIIILQFHAIIDKWVLLNPAGGGLGAVVAGYGRAGTYYSRDSSIAFSNFDVDAVIGSIYESVGPTGSGATNIWTELDAIPLTATAVELIVQNRVDGSATGLTYSSYLAGRQTGNVNAKFLSKVQFINRSNVLETNTNLSCVSIAVDSANRFDLSITTLGTGAVSDIILNLNGFWA